ncbi:NAD-dependent protein deacylase sirtuin-5, mitochondrial isoform X5 [Ailuropoda melanoleuca]|uniref:NAD-dependent protein deacylase sirtuin-5, mitochondrial isoform X5 n=1 Tax=Ailuropoda melanoleuca TaxID=9646 RepID=UPI00094812B7|nr:NAD-dependent protein deacylase sirtuin-5, mitochondrial isoform X5 [Ailuropoda melanoleuca]
MERIVNAVEGKPDRENIVNVWKDYTGKDAIIVRERATKAIKPKTINSCWRKLLPNVVLDFSGFTTQPIKKAMEKTVAVAEKTVGVAKKDLATPQAFARNPSLVWEFYHYRREVMLSKEPNPGHLAIAECEARLHGQGRRVTVITQNIDELHRRAGTKNLLEIHGSLFKTRCTSCGIVAENYKSPICPALSGKGAPDPETQDARIPVEKLPRCEEAGCGGLLRPHVVWFGENLDPAILEEVDRELTLCDLCLVVGTSSVVYPAAMFAPQVSARGVPVAEFNMETTPATNRFRFHFQGPCGTTLPEALAPHETENVS